VSPRQVWGPPVAGGRWVGSHGACSCSNLAGLWSVGLVCLKAIGPAEWILCVPVDCLPGRSEGHGPVEMFMPVDRQLGRP
jgi:hypothetical protein